MTDKQKTNNIISILLIIFIYPFGIPFMWLSGSFSLKTRVIITIVFLLAIFIGFATIILWTSSPGYLY